ncbi:MAG: GMC family oxidoreductase [Amaricoccus sp.]
MEAGELDFSERSQAFYVGQVVGESSCPTDESRLRYFGGTSGHWEGKCRLLDPTDFRVRPWMPLSGWPIDQTDLDPFLAEAAAIVDLPQARNLPDLPCAQAEVRFRQFQWQWSAPTRFGEKFRDELVASGRVTLGINANLVDLGLSDDKRTVTSAHFRSYAADDPGFTVRARAYALCMGGLENPRALLNCRSQRPMGIGNEHDLVGRYFCDRPTVATADLLLAGPFGDEVVCFAPTPEFAAAQRLANFSISIEPRTVHPLDLEDALTATASCLTPGIQRMLERNGSRGHCLWGGLTEFSVRHDPQAHPVARIGMSLEQALNPDSRVSLGEDKDAFGLNRLRLDWRLTEADYRTLREATIAFGAHVAEQQLGRLRLRRWLLRDDPELPEVDSGSGLVDGRQHMCTTRMSTDPATGVVDADCRVHSVDNLFIGGSSVFATPGNAKPTFTIVQLALRLGQHIGQLLAV